MKNNLSELSKPVAWTWNAYGMQHATTEEDESAELILDGVDVNPLYSQEYVSALLAGLEENIQTFHLLTNDSALSEAKLEEANKRIATLEAKLNHYVAAEHARASFDQTADIIKRADDAEQAVEELRAKLATPVRLQSPWEDNVGNRWLLEGSTADAIRAAGFTVEGDE